MTTSATTRNRYVYGPVHSWRAGTALGIDPIGEHSTCSFNCVYCQLGKIQTVTTETKIYVPAEYVTEDLRELEAQGHFNYEDLDVITFAGSGEPTLAKNLGEMILAIKDLYKNRSKQVPISILTNATMFNDAEVRKRTLEADLISLKLDAPNDEILRAVNQPAPGITMASIISGIKALKEDLQSRHPEETAGRRKDPPVLQLQIMVLPKWIATSQASPAPRNDEFDYVTSMAKIIKELGITKLQINTPTREKPVSKTGEYWIDTRGNHYSEEQAGHIKPEFIEVKHLPVITKEEAFAIEDRLRELLHDTMPELEIINVYKRG